MEVEEQAASAALAFLENQINADNMAKPRPS